MTTQSKILIALAVAALLAGAIVVVWTAVGWRVIAGTDMCSLTTRYDPKGDPNYQAYRTYDDLYRLTKHIAEQHNDFAVRFLCTLGFSFFGAGVILLAWSIDRERLYRRMRDPERQ
jgi:hypothetical protein